MNAIFRVVVGILFVVLSSSAIQAQTVKQGLIKGKSVSWTTGSVKIVKKGSAHELQLGGDFKTKSGPGLYVYLGNGGPEKNIGKLKSIKGAQSYAIPQSIDPAKYKNVYIYCKPFKVTFGAGRLK